MSKKGVKFLLNSVKRFIDFRKLPERAQQEHKKDCQGLPDEDHGIDDVVKANIEWLYSAQQNSPDADGCVARHFSLINGWGHSYPETTGYIIPTLLDWHRRTGDKRAPKSAENMLDGLVKIQFPEGGFQGGTIEAVPKIPVTFNTGQILLGLAAGASQLDEKYLEPMNKAATWLRDSIDEDGAWRRHPTPYAAPGDKTYETHVAWGLLEADRVAPGQGYEEAALRNIRWALTNQQENGWYAACCLVDPEHPLTHTIGYALRGILEGWRYSRNPELFQSACITAESLIKCIDSDGKLPGRLDHQWNPAVSWVCLTGSSQIAHCLLMIFQENKEEKYLTAAKLLNKFVRRTVKVRGDDFQCGGVKGSFPVSGEYGHYQFLNWAVKFTIDANLLESDIADELVKSPDNA